MIFTLLLTIGLDMTLPEFQPEKDLSGNFIMGSYDVSSDDFVVEVLEDVPEEAAPSVDESLTSSPERSEQLSVSGNDDIVSAIQSLQEDNNAYWELFLDSYPVFENHSIVSSSGSHWAWKFNSSGAIISADGTNDRYAYIPVQSGVEYTISSIFAPTYNSYYCGVVDDLQNPTSVSDFLVVSSPFNGFSINPTSDGYLVFYINYWRNVDFNVSWTNVYQESYTLSELGNAVVEIRSNNDIKFRVLIFLTLINFAYPIVVSICKNIVGGDK